MKLLHPWWLALGAVVLFLAWARWRSRRRVAHPHVRLWQRRHGASSTPSTLRRLARPGSLILFAAGLLGLLLGLGRPVSERPLPMRSMGMELMLCLDTSSSMRTAASVADEPASEASTRLTAAREAAVRFVRARPDDRIGLLTFARYPQLRCPLTRDHEALCEIISGVETVAAEGPQDATGIGTALAQGAHALQRTGGRTRVLVLLTDGEENVARQGIAGEIAPEHAGQLAAKFGVRVHAIVFEEGRRDAPLDVAPLEAVARRTGGQLHRADNASALFEIYAALAQLEQAPLEEAGWVRTEWTRWVLALACLLLVVAALLRALAVRAKRHLAAWLGPLKHALLPPRSASAGIAALCCTVAACLALVVAPGARERVASADGVEVVVCFDASRSMHAQDLAPSRLLAAKSAMSQLAASQRVRRLGLVAFAGSAELRTPLTRDRGAWRDLVARLSPADMPVGGTQVSEALTAARAALVRADASKGACVLVVTDAETPATSAGQLEALEAARQLAASGWPVHVLGVGSARGAKIPASDGPGVAFVRDAQGREVMSALDKRWLVTLASAGGGAAHALSTQLGGTWIDALGSSAARGAPRRVLWFEFLALAALVSGCLALALGGRRVTARGTAPARLAWLLLLILSACGETCDHAERGDAAFAAGDFGASQEHYAHALAGCRAEDKPILLSNLGLAALRAGDDARVRATIQALDQLEDPHAGGAFLRGVLAYRQGERVAERASAPGADVRLRERAMTHFEDALAAWRIAVLRRNHGALARENAERALLQLKSLREARRTGGQRRPRRRPGAPEGESDRPDAPQPGDTSPDGEPGGTGETAPVRLDRSALAPEEVLRLLDTLQRKDAERRALQRARRAGRQAIGGQDW